MATPFENVYTKLRRKITDFQFSDMVAKGLQDLADAILYGYLDSATVKFPQCRVDLDDRDEVLKQFNNNLSNTEQEILANLCIVEWLTPQINDILKLKEKLSDTDFKLYASAPLLRELENIKKMAEEDNDKLISQYDYNVTNLKKILGNG